MRKPPATLMVLSIALLTTTAPAGAAPPAAEPADRQPPPATQVAELPYHQSRSPLLAGTLSIVPGLGQVYNREYGTAALYFTTTAGLYLAACAYAGLFEPEEPTHLRYEAIFLFAMAGGIHLLSIFDATFEAIRVNENLDQWSVMAAPEQGGFSLACRLRF